MTAILFSLGTLANDIENGVSAWSKYRSSQTLFVRLRMLPYVFFNEKFIKSKSPYYLRLFSDHLQFFFCISILIFTAFFPYLKCGKNAFTWNEVFTCIE